MEEKIAIIGAGLAGCECALILARSGIKVILYEQKPLFHSEAHVSAYFSELVCSNSLRSKELTSGIGLLKQEMREMHSPFMAAADKYAVPADKALAVDRNAFAQSITNQILQEDLIEVVRDRIESLDDPRLHQENIAYIVIAAGPLISENLAQSLNSLIGVEQCYFYDAIAPIVWKDSLNFEIIFRASRYQEQNKSDPSAENTGDYLNCPMNRDEYQHFYDALTQAQTVPAKPFEKLKHFEGCMPIEALASRGFKTLAFGPLKPVGFIDPRTGTRPYAILQLRAENLQQDTYNLVGCQTRMLQSEQQRIFRQIPGLEQAEFARFGSMHRNTYVNAPLVLDQDLALNKNKKIFLAGQITGVEGYVESAACGLWVAQVIAARLKNIAMHKPPKETALGALLGHLEKFEKKFQPSNAHFGLMPTPEEKIKKIDRKRAYSDRARTYFKAWLEGQPTF